MKTSLHSLIGLAAFAWLGAVAPDVCRGQQGPKMAELLRPYLDAEFTPTDGPDTDKAFIREMIGQIKTALPEKLAAPRPKPKVLLVTCNTYGVLHVPGAAGLVVLLRESAAKHGAFELTEKLGDDISAEEIKGFDAVVLNNVGRASNPRFFNEVLPEYVAQGGGLLAVHSVARRSKST